MLEYAFRCRGRISVPHNVAKILFLKCPTAGKDLITTRPPESYFLHFAHGESIGNLFNGIRNRLGVHLLEQSIRGVDPPKARGAHQRVEAARRVSFHSTHPTESSTKNARV